MKILIVILAMSLMLVASVSFSSDLPIANPALSVDGSAVNLKFDLMNVSIPQQVKVLYPVLFNTGDIGVNEKTVLQPYMDYSQSTGKNKTTLTELYADGWKLSYLLPCGTAANQYLLLFVK